VLLRPTSSVTLIHATATKRRLIGGSSDGYFVAHAFR
jgi:hypothetical protein